jgi:transcriptional regulator with XRE-family HTH domain
VDPTQERLTRPDGLAGRLFALRERAGLSGKALAVATGWQPSKVSRLENGRQLPSPADLDAWARVCGADPATAQALLNLLVDVQTFHRDWKRRTRGGQESVQKDYNRLVRDSTVVRHFETSTVPGLLQTADYARRVLTEMADLHAVAALDVEAAVTARLQRQPLLYDSAKQFEFLIAEPVLCWTLCPPQVMRAQLDRLQTVIGLPNVRFGVLPMSIELHTIPQNSFQMYDDVAVVETFVGESTHRGAEAEAYARVLERLWEAAAIDDDARQLIIRASDGIDRTRS